MCGRAGGAPKSFPGTMLPDEKPGLLATMDERFADRVGLANDWLARLNEVGWATNDHGVKMVF